MKQMILISRAPDAANIYFVMMGLAWAAPGAAESADGENDSVTQAL